ncbi:hypothetical protein TcCL_NonESM08198 [Trypanosoma cruzi]|nr:hypothetical protein TcCL_NonESM08198 [Trypanosoma cruzi]
MAGREIPCSLLLLVCPQMLSLHANNVLQRVRGIVGFVCTRILFATLCGHATLEWWENGAGRCMAASPHCPLHGGAVHTVVLTLRCDCGPLCGGGGGWRRMLSCIGTLGSCLLFSLFLSFCEGVHLFLVPVMGQTDR